MSKKIVILGGAESGVGAALLAKKKGLSVWLSDGGVMAEKFKKELEMADIAYEENGHSDEKILAADTVVKSPGIPEKAGIVQKIRAANIELISEIEFGYRYKDEGKIIAITGSNGKTTTTTMIHHMLKTAGMDAAICGNIGYSFAKQIAVQPAAWYVVEVSSFQLDDIKEFKPDIAVLTNITEDHLDRYDYQFENYIKAKFKIINNQTTEDAFIYCADDVVLMNYINNYNINSNKYPYSMTKKTNQGGYVADNLITIAVGSEVMQMSVEDFKVKGKHNVANGLAAGIAGSITGIRKEKIKEAYTTLPQIPHRTEVVAFVRGVEYINDSKGTNVNSTWYALEDMKKPTILILGGVDKGNDYTALYDLVKEKVKAIICLGLDNRKIHEAFGNMVELIVNTQSAEEAVKAAYHFATPGDAVLLSPACASFDLFKNFEDRGDQFKAAVRAL
jgi:UDP-N-acetylmuramoylalanine--D-glutamate ligase